MDWVMGLGQHHVTLMEQYAALLVRHALAGRNLDLVAFCPSKSYMHVTVVLTFSTRCLAHLVHTQQQRVLVADLTNLGFHYFL